MTSTETIEGDKGPPIWAAPFVWLLDLILAVRERLAWIRRNRRSIDASTRWREAIPLWLDAERTHLAWLHHDARVLIALAPEFAGARPLIARMPPFDIDAAHFPEPRSARAMRLRMEAIGRSLANPDAAVRRFARKLIRACAPTPAPLPRPASDRAPRTAYAGIRTAIGRVVAWAWAKLRPP